MIDNQTANKIQDYNNKQIASLNTKAKKAEEKRIAEEEITKLRGQIQQDYNRASLKRDDKYIVEKIEDAIRKAGRNSQRKTARGRNERE